MKSVAIGVLRAIGVPILLSGSIAHADAIFDDPAVTPNEYFEEGPQWVEDKTTLPPMPDAGKLFVLDVPDASRNAYFFDPDSLTLGRDGVTRLTLVTRHNGGSETVTHEGIRCKTAQYRLYGIGNDGQWVEPKRNPWRPIPLGRYKSLRSELYVSVLCKEGFPMAAERIMKNLRYPSTAPY